MKTFIEKEMKSFRYGNENDEPTPYILLRKCEKITDGKTTVKHIISEIPIVEESFFGVAGSPVTLKLAGGIPEIDLSPIYDDKNPIFEKSILIDYDLKKVYENDDLLETIADLLPVLRLLYETGDVVLLSNVTFTFGF